MKNEINHEWIFAQAPAEVWTYLTDSELMALWLMPNDFKPLPGFEFKLHTKPMPELNLDGIFHCKVLSIDPQKQLSYSWKGHSENGDLTLDTICAWTLEPHGEGTRLRLKHSGFGEENAAIFTGMTNGWVKKIEQMLSLFQTRPTT
jgi:uncharacterized protein YndB with AHSA1/START domain